jgi:hypothetical protein
VLGFCLQKVLCRQRQRLFAVLQPLHDLAAQASRFSLLIELVASAQEIAAVGSAALKSLRASHSNGPVDRERYGLSIVVVEVFGWTHQARDNASDRVVWEDAAADVGRV